MITISVIIPTYGEPIFLKRTVDCILSQTFKDWELIIVDDNEPDSKSRLETEKIVNLYSGMDCIKYIKHPHNLNGATARNTGIAASSGKYIAFCDSDDEYSNDRLQKCYDIMENCNDESVGGVYTGCSFYKKGNNYFNFIDVQNGSFLKETLSCEFTFCSGSNIFMRADIVRELNGFDESFLRHQDYEFLVRFFLKYQLISIKELLLKKNNEGFNVPNSEKIKEIKKQYLSKYDAIICNFSNEDRNYIFRANYMAICKAALIDRNYSLYKEYLNQTVQISKLTIKEKALLLAFRVKGLLNKKGRQQ